MAGGAPLVGYIWYCGDDWCGCAEPRIALRHPRGFAGTTIWTGTFQTDHEYRLAQTELNQTAQAMRRRCHDLYERVEWPWDRKGSEG